MTLCECGCGGEASPGKRFISGHNIRANPLIKKGKKLSREAIEKRKKIRRLNKLLKEGKIELPFCACGCGGRVTKIGNKYIHGHYANVKNPMKDPKVAKKTGDSQRGEKNHNYGKKASEETRRKMSKSHPDNSGEKCYWYGKQLSEEHLRKILKAVCAKPNKVEGYLSTILQEIFPNEYKFVGDGSVIIGGFSPDFINVNGQKKIIEMFGDYWHRNDDEGNRVFQFRLLGFDTLIIWEHELNENEIEMTIAKIIEFHNR